VNYGDSGFFFELLQISDWSGGINRRFIHHLASRHIRPDARIIAESP
jgi:hypothetical protein